MSYKLGDTPSARPSNSELADFLEVECLQSDDGCFSVTEAAQLMGIIDDESTPVDEEEETLDAIKSALMFIEDRKVTTRGHYPFMADVSSVKTDTASCSPYYRSIYTFLLLATRENMNENRANNGIDGTVLFEHLCAIIMNNYLGGHCISYVFGTGDQERPSFLDKLKNMLSVFKEKGYSVEDNPLNPNIKDGGIDVVSFVPFEDTRQGHFIVFSQCKTGTNWISHVSDLQPSLLDDYISPSLVSKPYIAFMVSDDYQENDWRTLVRKTQGIVFDRCRLMSYLPDSIDDLLLQDINTWNKAVLDRYHQQNQ